MIQDLLSHTGTLAPYLLERKSAIAVTLEYLLQSGQLVSSSFPDQNSYLFYATIKNLMWSDWLSVNDLGLGTLNNVDSVFTLWRPHSWFLWRD